jgi:tetratricopeptide (TPR) repeat protein
MNNENTNLHNHTTIQNNQGDIIGVGVYGDNNLIAKNIRVDNLIVDLRSFGLELLHPDYFKQHDNVEENVRNWRRGFSLSLESIYYNKELERTDILKSIISKLNNQRCLLLLGESGSSKTTILNEVICHYFKQGYTIFYNYGDKEISLPEKIRDTVENTVMKGNKVLVAVDNVHDKRMSAIFYTIELLNSFSKNENVLFILTGRLPDYEWLNSYGLDILQERTYKDALRNFNDNSTLKYQIDYFSVEDIKNFILKFDSLAPLLTAEEILQKAETVYYGTKGNPVLVKFAILGKGLRKDVEDRIEDYLNKDSNYMITALATSILSICGIKITDEILAKIEIKKYAVRLERVLLHNSGNEVWTTIHSRWDMELLKVLFADQKDEIILDQNKEILKKALQHLFKIDDEDIVVSIIHTLYNTVAISNLIPIGTINDLAFDMVPSSLGSKSLSLIYGVIMPPALLMIEKYDTVEELCDFVEYVNPRDSEICYNVGLTYTAIGKYNKAIKWFDKAIAISPDYGEVWYMRACINMEMGNINTGLDNLERAILISKKMYTELAKRETYFKSVKDNSRFIALVNGTK